MDDPIRLRSLQDNVGFEIGGENLINKEDRQSNLILFVIGRKMDMKAKANNLNGTAIKNWNEIIGHNKWHWIPLSGKHCGWM